MSTETVKELTEEETVDTPVAGSQRVLNIKHLTTIPNSTAQHSIFTYTTSIDTVSDIKRKGFFDPAYSFIGVGDTIRVFQYSCQQLVKYYEFIVMDVDKLNRLVKVAITAERSLEKLIIV